MLKPRSPEAEDESSIEEMKQKTIATMLAGVIAVCVLTIPHNRRSDDSKSQHLFTDMNGFVLNSSAHKITVNVGVGQSNEEFVHANPLLKDVVWRPKDSDGQVFNEMRFSLQSDSDINYSDGDLKFTVCGHSVSADGNEDFKHGVAFVGIKLCESPINDYKRAIALAMQVIRQVEKNGPDLKNMEVFYRTATAEELNKIGGPIWKDSATQFFKDLPPRRTNPDSGEYIFSSVEAEAYFAKKLAHPTYQKDVNDLLRPIEHRTKLGIYAGRKTIFEIGVSSNNHYGGTNLTKAELDELRYDITMGVRFRSDIKLDGNGHLR